MNCDLGNAFFGWYVPCHGSVFNPVTLRTMIFQKLFLRLACLQEAESVVKFLCAVIAVP
jgi:hypothetical protein